MFKREMSNQRESELTLTQKHTQTFTLVNKVNKTKRGINLLVTVKMQISFSTRFKIYFYTCERNSEHKQRMKKM